ncbi:MAG: LA_3696 family protein, partial [bacterium]
MAIVTIEKPLREKLGDAGADSLVRLINQSHENQKNDILEFVEEKFERRLTQEIMGLEKRLIERIADGENKLLARIIESESRLLDRIMDGE